MTIFTFDYLINFKNFEFYYQISFFQSFIFIYLYFFIENFNYLRSNNFFFIIILIIIIIVKVIIIIYFISIDFKVLFGLMILKFIEPRVIYFSNHPFSFHIF
jgi:hypothetical protein